MFFSDQEKDVCGDLFSFTGIFGQNEEILKAKENREDTFENKLEEMHGLIERPGDSEEGCRKAIKEKRERGRINSKVSRQRKKQYVRELEEQVEELKKENLRLASLLVKYKENGEEKGIGMTDPSKIAIEINTGIKKVVADSLNNKSNQHNDMLPDKGGKFWITPVEKLRKKFSIFLDEIFKLIINNLYPNPRVKYWKNWNKEYSTDYDIIKKLNNCSKYKMPEFIEKHNISELDEFVASLKPTKKQFNFVKVILTKEFEIKQKYSEIVKILCKVKTMIQEACCEMYSVSNISLRSGIFSDKTLINSRFAQGFLKEDDAFLNIWNVQSEPQTYKKDLGKDKIVGRLAKSLLPKSDIICSFDFLNFSIKD
ncbi:unnamed protein product [Moneuplotes crassus]|uniref:BZIP domain-containing protein n=1 Tax=Euplotes crassus TaxID=5936 RepID=A0AAD1URD7_EUPCR|nr:unnamed protein product [Moneuplotes crassus]